MKKTVALLKKRS